MFEFKPLRETFYVSNVSIENFLVQIKGNGGVVSSHIENKSTKETILKTCPKPILQNCLNCVYKDNCENPVTA